MRLPGHGFFVSRNGAAADPEQQVEPEPDSQKREDARVAEHHGQRGSGDPIALRIVMTPAVERTAGLECKSARRRHKARDRRGRANHWRNCPPISENEEQKICSRAGGGGDCEEQKIPPTVEAA